MAPKKKTGPAADGGLSLDGHFSSSWAIKLPDGDALMRADIQYDLLSFIFGNAHYRFTPPTYTSANAALFPTNRQWTFAELYLDCLANSTKAARTLREKMAESQSFAVGFAKIGLLCNTGRLNTTIALNKEVKAHRTYHPIPSIQLDEFTRKNVPDAPRMKAQVKGCQLPSEAAPAGLPQGLKVIAERGANGNLPPTTPATLIFWLLAEHAEVTARYVPDGFDMNKLFWNMSDVSSSERANAFLAIIHRFLETPNARDDLNAPPGTKIDLGIRLTRHTGPLAHENVDSPEELAYAKSQKEERQEYVAQLQEIERVKAVAADAEPGPAKPPRVRARGKKDDKESTPAAAAGPTVAAPASHAMRPLGNAVLQRLDDPSPTLDSSWRKAIERDPHRDSSLVHLAWQRIAQDADLGRDPLYDSDNEDQHVSIRGPPSTPRELRSRVATGFVVRAPEGGLARTRYLIPGATLFGGVKQEESDAMALDVKPVATV